MPIRLVSNAFRRLKALPPGARLVWCLALLWFIGAVIYLIAGPNPWSEELDFSREAKESVRTHAYVVEGEWWACVLNLGLSLVVMTGLFFFPTNARLSQPSHSALKIDTEIGSPASPRERKFILALILLAMGLSAFLNYPLLHFSLWGDEEATTRRFIVGHVHRKDDDSLKLVEPQWQKTIWNYDNGPNNHNLFSVLSRLSHSLGTQSHEPDEFYFSAVLIRLPSYLSGIISVAVIAWLAALLGFLRAAPLTAFFAAVHPWLIRWDVEARGYSLELLLAPLAIALMIVALRAGRWRWWLLFGVVEVLLFYAHLGSLYLLVPLNLAALFLAWRPGKGRWNPLTNPQLWRWGVANGLAAMAVIQLLAPCLRPLKLWLASPRAQGDIGWPWIEDALSFFASGMPWNEWDAANPNSLTLAERIHQWPVLSMAALALLTPLFFMGLVWFLTSLRRAFYLSILLTPTVLTILQAKIGGKVLYPWYLVGFLPQFLMIIAIGAVMFPYGLRISERWRPYLSAALSVLSLAALLFLSQPQRHLYRSRGVELLEQSVRHMREVVNPFAPGIDDVITLGYVHHTRLYDPAARLLNLTDDATATEDFVKWLRAADAESKPLYVNTANLGLARQYFPTTMNLLENPEVFEPPVIFPGLQEATTRYVYRYRPGAVAKLSLSR